MIQSQIQSRKICALFFPSFNLKKKKNLNQEVRLQNGKELRIHSALIHKSIFDKLMVMLYYALFIQRVIMLYVHYLENSQIQLWVQHQKLAAQQGRCDHWKNQSVRGQKKKKKKKSSMICCLESVNTWTKEEKKKKKIIHDVLSFYYCFN